MVDALGATLPMLKSHDSFHVVAHLEQGRGGTEDVDHSDVPFQDDLILAEFLQTGGLRSIDLKSSTTPAGLANWSIVFVALNV